MGDDEQLQSPVWKDAERERRQQALASLARQAQSATGDVPSASAMPATARPISLAPRRARPARRALLVALLAAIVLASAGIAFWRTHQPQAAAQRPIPTTLTIRLRLKELYCPSGVTWSPDGLTIAVLAQRNNCLFPGSGPSTPVLAFYNARTGALEHVIDPYSTLARLTDTNHALGSFIWSRDSTSLTFFVGYNTGLVNPIPASGLLYYPLDGGSPRYIAGPAVSYPGAVIWNLDTNTVASIVDTPPAAAASYSWTADGHIIADVTPSHAAGHFSLWQSGILNPIQPVVNDSPAFLSPPVTLFWASVRTLVSSDGRHAVAGLTLSAQMPTLTSSTPKIDAKTCGYFEYEHLCEQPVLPYPDDAFAIISADASSGYTYSPQGSTDSFTVWNAAQLAYRPDGKVLAAILPNAVPQNNPSEERITFFDAASGAQLGIVTATVVSEASLDTPGIPFLAWSPSGKQLAFFDYGASTVTLWGGVSLPA